MTGIFSVAETNEVYILSGPSMNYGQPKAHTSLSHLFIEAVSNFVEEMLSYVILGNNRICRFLRSSFGIRILLKLPNLEKEKPEMDIWQEN